MPFYALHATDKAGMLALRLQVRESHRAYLRLPRTDGVVVLHGGPTLDERGQMNGTLLIFQADSLEAVRRFVQDDPYTRHGLFETVDIRAWQWGLGRPAHDPTVP